MFLQRCSRACAACLLAAALTLGSPTLADELRLVAPGNGAHLAQADSRDGWMLVAWRFTDDRWSRVEVRNGDRAVVRDFPGILIKGARWAEPGARIVLGVVGPEGPQSMVYALTGDRLVLEWSSPPTAAELTHFTISPRGDRWISTRFEKDAAEVSIGRFGETEALWTWRLDAARHGQPEASWSDYSNGFFLDGSTEPPGAPGNGGVGILWGARAWVAWPSSDRLVRIEPPSDCWETQAVTPTSAGLWLQCYHGIDAEISHSWAFYPGGLVADETAKRPALIEQFQAPEFLLDGTVLDRINREGRTKIYRLGDSRNELVHAGTLRHPPGARTLVAGDVLLIDEGDSPETYRALPISQ